MQARADVPQRAAEPVLGGEALPERGRVVHHVPLPRPLPSSGAVRHGAWTRQGPLRPPTARDASASGGVAVSGGGHSLCRRLRRRAQPPTTRPPARARESWATKLN